MASAKVQWRWEANSVQSWPEWSRITECCLPDMLKLQQELQSKAAERYATTHIINEYFFYLFGSRIQATLNSCMEENLTWNWLPQGWNHSPTIYHGMIWTTLELREALEHLQYIDDIIMWEKTAEEVFEKRKTIIQVLLKASFAIK